MQYFETKKSIVINCKNGSSYSFNKKYYYKAEYLKIFVIIRTKDNKIILDLKKDIG